MFAPRPAGRALSRATVTQWSHCAEKSVIVEGPTTSAEEDKKNYHDDQVPSSNAAGAPCAAEASAADAVRTAATSAMAARLSSQAPRREATKGVEPLEPKQREGAPVGARKAHTNR